MNPLLNTFVRLTVGIAVVLIALWLLAQVFHVIIIAAIIAAVVVGGLFLYNVIRGRSTGLSR
jgi:cytochrome bd-type quinol oxidase subunit 1